MTRYSPPSAAVESRGGEQRGEGGRKRWGRPNPTSLTNARSAGVFRDSVGFGYDLPTAGRSRDFHPLERALAGRTRNSESESSKFEPSGPLFRLYQGFSRRNN